MRALLISSFRYMGQFFVPRLKFNKTELTCLFVGYALDNEDHINMCKNVLKNNLPIKKLIDLQPNYDFNDDIDIIFINGGFTNDLLEKLCKYNQLEIIKNKIINEDVVYIGESAASDYAGDYSNYHLLKDFPQSEQLIKQYGKKIYDGFRFINKMIITHACQYRVRRLENGEFYRVPYGDQYKTYLRDIKVLKRHNIDYETIANNEAILIEDNHYKKIKYDWSKFPIREIQLTEQEKKLKELVMSKQNKK